MDSSKFMTSLFGRWNKRLLFCFFICLLINCRVFALDKKTSSALSHYIMAIMYENLGELDRAIYEYQRVLRRDFESSVIHLRLAASFIKKNEIKKAIEELNLAAKFAPEAVEPHAILALLYLAEDKSDLAQVEYERALENASKIQPENIQIYKSLGTLYLAQKKFKEAENTYRLILNLSPGDAEAHFYLGNIYDELKNRDACIKELKNAIVLKPDYPEALNYLGYVYVEENKNLDEAEIMIKKALEIEPNNGAYVDSLGWLYFKQGKFKESIKELERAVSLLEDPVIYDHLGDVYFKLDDLENAKINWQKSLDLDPEQEKVKQKLEKVCPTLPVRLEN